MDCSCIRNNYDFLIKSIECDKILYTDLSDWMDDERYIDPETYTVQIKHPNNSTTSEEVKAKGETKLSLDACLTDGVYCFTTESCGVKYTRHVAIIPSLECSLDKFIASTDDFNKVYTLKSYIESIKVNARMGKPQKASELFDIAKKELSNINCDY